MTTSPTLSVGDRMRMSVDLIEELQAAELAHMMVIVRVKAIRRDADGLVTLVLERDPNGDRP
jgi:hypothetical protein